MTAAELTPHCPRGGSFCETCGGRDRVRGVLRDTTGGAACLVQCAGCAANPLVLSATSAELFASEHRVHVTRTGDDERTEGKEQG